MDTEKIINSKWFLAFEWMYRLLFLNMFTYTIPLMIASPIYLIWYFTNQSFILYFTLFIVIFTFIPCYFTTFIVIKLYKENRVENIFKTYFYYLWDTFKSIFLMTLFLIPIFTILTIGISYYWELIGSLSVINFATIIGIIGYVLLFFTTLALIFAFFQIPLIIAYFRMKTKTLIRFAFMLTYKYFFKNVLYVIFIMAPFVLWDINNSFFTPVLLTYGFSMPLFLIYLTSREQMLYLVASLEDKSKP